MKWIKATKQLPEKAGFYVVRAKSAAVFGGQAYFNEKRFEFRQGVHESEIEWLDESPSPLSGEEIKPFDSAGDSWVDMVLDWHKKFGVDVGDKPKILRPSRFQMRHNILKEEVDELEEAFWLKDKTIIDVADAICDILYVIIGTAIEFGLHDKLNELFSEVHRSNMSKLDENGNPVKREDGKILKSKLFSPPNLKGILMLNSDIQTNGASQGTEHSKGKDDTKNNSLNSGEQQPVTGGRVEVEFEFMFPYGEHKGGGAYNLSSPIIIPNEKLPLIKQAIEQVLNHQPPTPEPAGELYRWRDFDESDKSTWPPSKKGCFVRWLEDGREIIGGCHIFDWFNDNKFDVSDDDDVDPKNPRGAQPHQWLEKVEPQQNQDE